MKEAKYYQTKGNGVQCQLCPQMCFITEGETGLCQSRINEDGVLKTANYARISSMGIDPIEKKPLYHFFPGSRILSVGTFGCNFSCQFCQNWQISQNKPPLQEVSPAELVDIAVKKDTIGIAYTYSEPSIWYEYIEAAGKLVHENNLKNVMVTNGYLNKEPLTDLIPLMDGINIDLKSFNEDFYKKVCGGRLEPVLDNIKLVAASKDTHLELTTLIIPDYNDNKEELKHLFKWIADIDTDIPLHLSRYYPKHKLNAPQTPVETMELAYQRAKDYLNNVYIGNMNTENGTNTFCPVCNKKIIERKIYSTENKLKVNKCPECGRVITGTYK
ncbi:MAG: AmmeMemoRadiSam system radical SAM enzyme [Halothermotrichaceae bacterium]